MTSSWAHHIGDKFAVESQWESSTWVDDLERDDIEGSHFCQCPVAGPMQQWT